MRRWVALTSKVNKRVHSSRLRLRENKLLRLSSAGIGYDLHDGGVFQLRQQLYQRFAQRWHDVCRIVFSKTANQSNSRNSIVKVFVVESDKKGADVLCLRQVLIESLVKVCKHNLSDLWVCNIDMSIGWQGMFAKKTVTDRDLQYPRSAAYRVHRL